MDEIQRRIKKISEVIAKTPIGEEQFLNSEFLLLDYEKSKLLAR
ncbi:hypothetical protein [Lentilactobacillus kosonis]|uniref:Uncharacterized protein n=1 Tax=Lentilactobacillus kosonis TaxID=2810561 RepID=A0A401FPQ1_9LACO|nr:hypothetical protein [Lentilactobacillus kosonis]GAY74317.1 hypothetical protein NBRC111893_2463 [Lentilactobacillus kosonis]